MWQATEQPSGKFACADPTTRAEDAALSMCRICATVSLQPLCRLQHVQHLPPSDQSLHASDLEGGCIRCVEGVRGRHCLTHYAWLPVAAHRHQCDKPRLSVSPVSWRCSVVVWLVAALGVGSIGCVRGRAPLVSGSDVTSPSRQIGPFLHWCAPWAAISHTHSTRPLRTPTKWRLELITAP